jgi:flagellar P-ring protein precursor FlgI
MVPMARKLTFVGFILTIFMIAEILNAQSARIKDLANIRGVRDNQLVGFGLVIGLSKTGDSATSLATNNAVSNMLSRLGMRVEGDQVTSQSIAGVIVTANLPVFKRNGDKIDVKVSTIGDAASLAGGTLLMTPLRAGDGKVYVVAQGSVVVGQANGTGPAVLTAAMVPAGGLVEREFLPAIAPNGKLTLSLKRPDFTTSTNIADTINGFFKGYYAQAQDPASVEVEVPPLYRGRLVEFVADMEGLTSKYDQKAVVVLNERTGTIVMGSDVVVSAVTISHGDLSIKVAAAEDSKKDEEKANAVVSLKGTTVGNLVETINALGVKPADLVGILQAIHAAGALQADLRFM